MLMAWGPFMFTVPTYSVEALSRSISPRIEAQPVIGATPPLHRLGPTNETVTLSSTFHPMHLNGGGLAQLAGVRAAASSLVPFPLVHINGLIPNVFGLWIAKSVSEEQTMFDAVGRPQTVTVKLEMTQEGGIGATARGIANKAISGIGSLF